MANNWIQSAIKKPNALRKTLKVKAGQKIPLAKLKKAASGKLGAKTERRAKLALTLRKLRSK